jgi:tRNA threonylcarbamoyl adenosine modification protein YjeE
MSLSWKHSAVPQSGLGLIAERVAFALRTGDVVALRGDLGAGKTTFARCLLRALAGDDAVEVVSPTFSLVQTYASPRFEVAHFDLYRLAGPEDVAELGLEEALTRGVVLIEWPERIEGLLPANRLEVLIADTAAGDPDAREVTLTGHGAWAGRLERLMAIDGFLRGSPWERSHLRYIQGDASPRRYARLVRDGETAVLMDAPRQPDGPPIRNGLPYSRIARLAEDVVPYIAVGGALRQAGLSAPDILMQRPEDGLLLLEDLGDNLFGRALAAGADQAELWTAAVDVLLRLRRAGLPLSVPLGGGAVYRLPPYDRAALEIELELLLDWYWPVLRGERPSGDTRSEFLSLWGEVLDGISSAPPGWVLRDFHSPNLMWLSDRAGVRRVGILDFQDAVAGHPAYDLVSLLQDARLDVPADLEARLLAYYLSQATGEGDFDEGRFRLAYAALGAQRSTKILGIFTRLSQRDGKHQYLAHIPRLWRYLERNLDHVTLRPLKAWYDRSFPPALRTVPVRG